MVKFIHLSNLWFPGNCKQEVDVLQYESEDCVEELDNFQKYSNPGETNSASCSRKAFESCFVCSKIGPFSVLIRVLIFKHICITYEISNLHNNVSSTKYP